MDISQLLEMLQSAINIFQFFRSLIGEARMKSLMKLEIMVDLEPKYERVHSYIEKIKELITEFLQNKEYSCEDFQKKVIEYVEIIGYNFKELIKGTVELYEKDLNLFGKIVKDDYFYIVVEKWAEILKENKNASLGNLLISVLDIVKTMHNKEKELEWKDLKILTNFQNMIQSSAISKEFLRERFHCISEIQPRIWKTLGFLKKDLEEGAIILDREGMISKRVEEVLEEMKRREFNEPE